MFKTAVLNVLKLILSRYRKHRSSYPFIDMKIDTITGEEFPDNSNAEDGILGIGRSRNTIFTWIQGRGLEALAGHYYWLKNSALTGKNDKKPDLELISELSHLVVNKLESFREQNSGRMWFIFDTNGTPFTFEKGMKQAISLKDIPYNFSDIFYVKGLMASSVMIKDSEKTEKAKKYCKQTLDAILSGIFASDQISFDPENPVITLS